jgi:hypothetical protein
MSWSGLNFTLKVVFHQVFRRLGAEDLSLIGVLNEIKQAFSKRLVY